MNPKTSKVNNHPNFKSKHRFLTITEEKVMTFFRNKAPGHNKACYVRPHKPQSATNLYIIDKKTVQFLRKANSPYSIRERLY